MASRPDNPSDPAYQARVKDLFERVKHQELSVDNAMTNFRCISDTIPTRSPSSGAMGGSEASTIVLGDHLEGSSVQQNLMHDFGDLAIRARQNSTPSVESSRPQNSTVPGATEHTTMQASTNIPSGHHSTSYQCPVTYEGTLARSQKALEKSLYRGKHPIMCPWRVTFGRCMYGGNHLPYLHDNPGNRLPLEGLQCPNIKKCSKGCVFEHRPPAQPARHGVLGGTKIPN